jgi:hypothetical protein
MIEYLELKNVGPASEMKIHWAKRLNLITGDNGLGKTFLLDIAWWALTRTWANSMALPNGQEIANIAFKVNGESGKAQKGWAKFSRANGAWPSSSTSPVAAIVVYIRVDGGFSVWDPARNYWRNDAARPAAYHFSADDVWNGLDINGLRVCEGLERDWVSWQKGKEPQFAALQEALRELSPAGEMFQAGEPKRLSVGEGRDRPTLLIGGQTVPVALASAGVRRILALAYFLVWAWFEHRVAAQLLGKEPTHQFVILFDEPETHLHPRWQRTLLPSLIAALDKLRVTGDAQPQFLIATHSPLVLASLEGVFDPDRDDLLQLIIQDGQVCLEQGHWATQGDVSSWLESDIFGLKQARSLAAEQAIDAAEAFMRGEKTQPTGFKTKAAIHKKLQQLLPAHDAFWPRWLIQNDGLPSQTTTLRSKS